MIVITPKFTKRIPAFLIAMVIVTLIQRIFQFEGVATIGSSFGEIPRHIPYPKFPEISLDQMLDLVGPAFTIALLGAIESLLSAVADSMTSLRHNANQELIGQGLANLVCPLFSGFVATGAVARTATNVRNGGNSPLPSIIHSLTLLCIILIFVPLTTYIPLCTLAAILFVIAYNMSEIQHFIYTLKQSPRNDILVLLTTFLLTIFVDLVVAANVGVILALFFFTHRMSQSVVIERETDTALQAELARYNIILSSDILIYTIQGPFFFSTTKTLGSILDSTHTNPKILIFRLKYVPFMDMTGLKIFYEVIEKFYKRGIKVYLCEANTKVSRKLAKIDILQWVGDQQIFSTLLETLKACTEFMNQIKSS